MCFSVQLSFCERKRKFIVSLLTAIGREVVLDTSSCRSLWFPIVCLSFLNETNMSWVFPWSCMDGYPHLISVSWLSSQCMRQFQYFTRKLLFQTSPVCSLSSLSTLWLILEVSALGSLDFFLLILISYVLTPLTSHCLIQLSSCHDFAFTEPTLYLVWKLLWVTISHLSWCYRFLYTSSAKEGYRIFPISFLINVFTAYMWFKYLLVKV